MAILLAIPLFIIFFGALVVILYVSEKYFPEHYESHNDNSGVNSHKDSYKSSNEQQSKRTISNYDEYSNYCTILELQPNCTIIEIKESYKDLVKVWHPDRYHHDEKLRLKAQDKLKKINEAYSYLMRNAT